MATKGLAELAQLIYSDAQPQAVAPAQTQEAGSPLEGGAWAGWEPDVVSMAIFTGEQQRRHDELGARVSAWLAAHPRRRRRISTWDEAPS